MNIDTTETTQTTETAIGYIPCYRLPFLSLFHADCMEIMKQYPDKYFDLAIVDPPYGIGFSDYERGGSGIKVKERFTKNGKKDWDYGLPTIEYFNELKRISKNQIIWGGNYFDLQPTQCFLFWYKQNPVPNFADGELAWTSFNKPALCFDYRYYGNIQGKSSMKETKIHPTQKPIELYNWILKHFANENDKIIDTHFGSGSIALAVDEANRLDKMNLHLTACEIDKEYIDKAIKRISESIKQGTLSF
jgi:site-specific DNA-methyltransferase (adenine-specific)